MFTTISLLKYEISQGEPRSPMVPEFPTHPYGRVCCSISLSVHVPTIFQFEDVDVVVVLPEQHELRLPSWHLQRAQQISVCFFGSKQNRFKVPIKIFWWRDEFLDRGSAALNFCFSLGRNIKSFWTWSISIHMLTCWNTKYICAITGSTLANDDFQPFFLSC